MSTLLPPPFQSLLWSTAIGAALLFSPPSTAFAYLTEGRVVTLEASDWREDDNTALFTKLLDESNPSWEEVIVPAAPNGKTWKIGPLHIKHHNFTLRLKEGAVLEAKEGAYSLPSGTQSMIKAHRLHALKLIGEKGATIRMNKEEYATMRNSEWRHNLDVSSCKDVVIEGITFEGAGGDGIYIGAGDHAPRYCENVVIRNVVIDGAARNALSIISVDRMLVEGSTFKNTQGVGNIARKGPWAGIDVEPNKPDERIRDLVIRNCRFLNNGRYGFLQATTFMRGSNDTISILVEDCEFSRNNRYGIVVKEVPGTLSEESLSLFRRCIVKNHPKAAIGVIGKAHSAGKVVFEDCRLLNNRTDGPGELIELNKFGAGRRDEPIGNVFFNQLTVE